MKNRIIIILILFCLTGCQSEDSNWEEAKTENSEEKFEAFIRDYPSSKYLTEAKEKLNLLHEDEKWRKAVGANNIQSFEEYLIEYNNGRYTKDADSLIHLLKERKMWEIVNGTDSINVIEKFLELFPSGEYKDVAYSQYEVLFWAQTKNNNSVISYREFLNKFPEGKYSLEAQKSLDKALYDPSVNSIKLAIEKCIREKAMGEKIGSYWHIDIKDIKREKFNHSKGYLKVYAATAMTDGTSYFTFGFIDHFRLRTSDKSRWYAEIVKKQK